ncbi:hypothetical protein [Azospirillum sp. Sh1]|uniref:hypothetical protein n=1 Tax=Azospirillum sp. Sh1 TaxID=2607285 RepID=UPI0011EDA502|nr:hypothetical protein [Azospirillum sp. Sh1]KAA0571117.1 hypothetical protein FZ029_28090 [Azospirillum sp. Sh1]
MPYAEDLKAIAITIAVSLLALAAFGTDLAAWLNVNVGALALGTLILAAGMTVVLRSDGDPTLPWTLCVAGVMIAAAAPLFASHLLVNEGAIRIGSWLAYLTLGPVSMESITREVAEGRVSEMLQTPWLYAPALALFICAGVVKAMR